MKEKIVDRIGWCASIMAIMMYFSYIDQIMRNLHGNKGSMILPIVTTVNCSAWIIYAALKPRKDWPIIVCNLPGVVLGVITALTSIP